MKTIKLAGLCLVAVLVFTAVAAASASAEPTYKSCVKAPKNEEKKLTGGYNDKLCSEVNIAGEGKYEAVEVITPLNFEGKSKTTTIYFHNEGGLVDKLVCKKDKEGSQIESPTSENGTITFEKCEVFNALNERTKCASPMGLVVTGVLGETEPAEKPGDAMILALGGNKDECGTFKINALFGYRFGTVEESKKGAVNHLAVNPITFEQEINEFRLEGSETEGFMTAELEGVAGSVDVSVEGTEPLGPKGVVVIP